MQPVPIVTETTDYPFYSDTTYQILAEEHTASEFIFNNPGNGLISSYGFQLVEVPKISASSPIELRRIDSGRIIVNTLTTVADIATRDALTPTTGDVVYVTSESKYYVWHTINGWGWFVEGILPLIGNTYDYFYYVIMTYVSTLDKIYNKSITPISFNPDVADTATRDLIVAAEGMIVRTTDTMTWWYYDGAWQEIIDAAIYGTPRYTQSLVQILNTVQTIADRDALIPTTGDFIYVLDTASYYIYASSTWNSVISTGPYEVGQNIDYAYLTEIVSVVPSVNTQEDRDLLVGTLGDIVYVVTNNLYFIYNGSMWKLLTLNEIKATYSFNGLLTGVLETDYRIDFQKNYAYLEVNSVWFEYDFEIDYWVLPFSGYDNTTDINEWLANTGVPDLTGELDVRVTTNEADISTLQANTDGKTYYDDTDTTTDLAVTGLANGIWFVEVMSNITGSHSTRIREGGISGTIKGSSTLFTAAGNGITTIAIISGTSFYVDLNSSGSPPCTRILVTWRQIG